MLELRDFRPSDPLHTHCFKCEALIWIEDDDAFICVPCGGVNRRVEK